jgi:SAM-dependent methyltransferase
MRLELPPVLAESVTGETDPIQFYQRPLVGGLFRRRIEMGLELIPPLPQDARALEVGYAAGVVLYNLRHRASELYGLDLDAEPEPVQQRLASLGVSAELARGSVLDMRELYPDGWFDLVVAFSVLEHIRESDQVLAEIHRVLKPGGVAVIGMPAVNALMEWAFLAVGFKGIADHHVTAPATVWQLASRQRHRWRLRRRAMPGWLPFSLTLYHAFRLTRRGAPST